MLIFIHQTNCKALIVSVEAWHLNDQQWRRIFWIFVLITCKLKCCAAFLQGIICECCVYRCSYEEMKEYCGEDGGYNGPSAQRINSKRSQDQTDNTVKLKKIYPEDKSHDITIRGQSSTGTRMSHSNFRIQ